MAIAPGRTAANSSRSQGPPVVPAWLLHPTDQRLLFLSLFVLLQASKLAACLSPSTSTAAVAKWALGDAVFILGVGALRIPRLSWGWPGRALLVGTLVGLDWLLLAGGWRSIPVSALLPASVAQALTFYPTLSSSHARLSDVLKPKEHLSGAFELVITPFSTARILPQTAPLPCLSDRTKKIPLALHFSTMPGTIEYALTLPVSQGGETVLFNVSASALDEVKPRRSIEEAEAIGMAEEDEDDEADASEVESLLAVRQGVAARQALTASADSSAVGRDSASKGVTLLLPVDRPSTVRLSRVFPPAYGGSAGHHSFRIPLAGNNPVRVHRCPSASLIPQLPGSAGRVELNASTSGKQLAKASGSAFERCIGEEGTVDIVVRGEGGVTVGWSSVDGAGNKASGLLDGVGLDDPEASGAAADKSYLVPLPLTFDVAGRKTYSLTSLSSPHVPQLALEGQSVAYTVLPRPAVSFASTMSCSADRPLVLLNPAFVKHPKPDHLTILSEPRTPLAGHPFRSMLSFTPAAAAGERSEVALGLSKNLGQTTVRIDEHGEGLWRIESVTVDGADGRCGGDVKEPRECRVVYAPAPRLVRYDVRKLEDDCAGEQGVTVSFVLLGQAPFRLRYTLTTTPFATAKNPHPQAETSRPMYETLTSNTGELTLLPKQEGEYVYSFEQLADKRYTDGVAVEPATVRGSVRPVAAADFSLRGGWRELRLWACEGRQTELDVVISSGSPPFELEFLTTTATASTAETVTFATAGKHALTLPVPEALVQNGGNYTVSLANVRDGNGCGRKLKVKPVAVEVRVGRPTAKIAGSPGERVAVVTEGKVVSVPLRLTGDGPWSITYSKSTLGKPIELKDIRVANPETLFDEAATYKLLSVADAHCTGSIVPGQDTFEIQHLPRPGIKLEVLEGAVAVTKRKSWKPKGVCVGEEDHVALHFEGQAPFEAGYTIRRPSKSLVHTDIHRDILRAAGSSTTLALETDEPGYYTYTFDRVSDRNYGLSPLAGRSLTLDHEVYGRPSARWLSTSRINLCAHSKLTPAATASLGAKQGVLALKGKAPYSVTLHIVTPKSSQPVVRTIADILTDEWRIELGDFEFSQLGVYTVSVESVADASGCAQDLAGDGIEDSKAFRVEIAETASIVQVQKGEDVCVGQSLDFLLQGTAPWSLTTSFDGHERRVTQKDSKFSLLADKPGAFAITSISHQRNQCRTPVTDIIRRVHALPSARVRAGDRYVETVEEGEQAEIVFAFEGEAPFSFTYTRSTSGRLPTVLETHTVSGITEDFYSIFASAEGVWQVTEVEDRWCRFPPLAAARPDARPASLLEGIEVFPPIRAP